ncbi:ABC transporter permease (plasmid) [Haloimpatiens sp. FM7330]|uniref:ABC transporter permease n=1 Tax=Haloimpatiens sp. FM7330 TaxID=3298610 RepID=UPI0036423E64
MKDSKLIINYIKKQPKRTLSIIISIIIATALIVTIGIVSSSLKKSIIENARKNYGDEYARFSFKDKSMIKDLRDSKKFNRIGVSVPYGTFPSEKSNTSVNIEAWDKETIDIFNMELIKGKYPEKNNEICIDEWFLKENNIPLKIGTKIPMKVLATIENNGKYKEYKFDSNLTLSGILKIQPGVKYSGTSQGIVNLDTALENLPKDFIKYGVFVKTPDKVGMNKSLSIIKHTKQDLNLEDKDVEINYGLVEVLKNGNKPSVPTILFILIVVIAAIAVIYNIFNISILDRIRDYGIYRCLGFRPKKIRKLVIKEALLMSLISIPLGILVGYLISTGVYTKVSSLTNIENSKLTFSYSILIAAAIISLIGVFISTLIPAKHASKVAPLEAVTNTKSSSNTNKIKDKKWHSIIQKFFGNTGKLAYKNLWRNKKRTITTVFSFGFSIILFIVFTYFFNHFPMYDPSNKFTNGEYKLTMRKMCSDENVYSESAANKAKRIPGVENIIPKRYKEVGVILEKKNMTKQLLEYPYSNLNKKGDEYHLHGFLNGYNKDNFKSLNKYLVKGNLNSFNEDNDIIINKSDFTDMVNLNVGEKIIIRRFYYEKEGDSEPKYEDKKFKIKAIVSDMPFAVKKKGKGIGFMIGENCFKNFIKIDGYREIDVNVSKDADNDFVNNKLKQIADSSENGLCISYFNEIESIEKSRRNISLLMYSFIGFIALISIVNIINSMNTNILARTSEFGTLRAIGLNKGHIKKLVVFESTFYGIMSSIFGIIVSIIVCIVLYNVVEGMKSGIPIIPIIGALIMSVLISVLASLFPLRKVASMNIIDSIREVD